ncbi:hypothetical protein CG51_18605 [Haematobacter missouriensis]|uniref:Acyloxyacyl hydrolase n=1 Tax=Haematobacter missouriensis TaxID=366616 RepID=A0A212AM76_9RHOB|nr:acyloxyacyl hydrolase [Haematobacter missouriensis]KFI32997.1 hypothetical protein CG51_18605 [Haematobacter missouriensis]OWJ73100.1 acyloxyacyl hydrolase [Haematobacter missouriensis]OWJ82582.1 acyloxyacyl hydrolase [Haematobacter missouriensis]
MVGATDGNSGRNPIFASLTLLAVAATAGFMLVAPATAQSLTFAAGSTADGDAVFRVGYVHPWSGSYLERWGFERLVEVTVANWQTGPGDDSVQLITLAPVWHRQIWGDLGLELMIGLGFFSDQQVGKHDMGSQGHFQTGFGLSYPVGPGYITADIRHYSNAGLAKPNPGIEVYTVGYYYRF